MNLENKNIEDIFSKGFEEFKLEPDSQVLRNLRFKLWKTDFLSLNMKKFNLAYATVIVAGLVSIPYFSNLRTAPEVIQPENTISKKSNSEIEETFEYIDNSEVVQENKNNSSKSTLVPVARFKASAIKGCAPLKVHFDNESVAAETFSWNFGDGHKSTEKNPIHSYTIPGKYTVTLEINNKQSSKYNITKEIVVFEVPEPDFNIDIASSEIKSKTIAFENKSKGAQSYKWDFGDNTSSVTAQATHMYKDFNSYNVSLIAISENGCSDTARIINRFIEKDYSLYFPLSFRPGNAGASSDGIYGNEINNSEVFYPANNGVKEYKLKIFSNSGSNVFSTNNIKQGWNGYYRGRLAPAGVYRYEAIGVYPNGKKFSLKGKVKVIVDSYQDSY